MNLFQTIISIKKLQKSKQENKAAKTFGKQKNTKKTINASKSEKWQNSNTSIITEYQ